MSVALREGMGGVWFNQVSLTETHVFQFFPCLSSDYFYNNIEACDRKNKCIH